MVNINPFKVFLMAATILFCISITEANAQDLKVIRVQRALVGSGYNPGPVDGYWGNNTASALSQMAKDMGLALALKSKADITSEVLAALERAFQTHAEKQERDVLHLQEVMTLSDARHLLERTGIGAHPSEILQILG